MIGSTLMGYISDKFYGKRTPVAVSAVLIANILIYFVTFLGSTMSSTALFSSLFFFGMSISGLNNLVQGSCAADLGRKAGEIFKSNKSSSTVIGIVDATGALGASFGQLLIGTT